MTSEIQAAFGRLYAAECERMSAIEDLRWPGVIRSSRLSVVSLRSRRCPHARRASRTDHKGMRRGQSKRTIVCR